MTAIVSLAHCRIELTDWGCETRFHDGSSIGAHSHPDDHHYHVIAHRLGYDCDIERYCVEHEFCHSFVAEYLWDVASPVLWALAHDIEIGERDSIPEECLVQAFQRWLRANERPIIGGADWGLLKAMALEMLDSWRC